MAKLSMQKQLDIAELLMKKNKSQQQHTIDQAKSDSPDKKKSPPASQLGADISDAVAKAGYNALSAARNIKSPRSYKDFGSADDYYQFLLENTSDGADDNAVSSALKATLEQINMEKNSSLMPTEQSYRDYLSNGMTFYNDLEALYYQQLDSEKKAAYEKALSPYESLRTNADFNYVVQAGIKKEQPEYQRERSFGDYFLDALDGGKNMNDDAAAFQASLENPALWAARNSEELLQSDLAYSASEKGLSDESIGYLYMTDKELQLYTYLAETAGREKADEYFGILSDELSRRRSGNRYQTHSQWAKEHPWAASFLSLGTAIAQPVSYVTGALEYAATGDIDINSKWNAPVELTSSLREGAVSNVYDEYNEYAQKLFAKYSPFGEASGGKPTKEELDELEKLSKKADTLAFFANTGYSMADSALSLFLGGGSAGMTSALMGGEAAGATLYNSLTSGKSAEQALAEGGVSAFVETMTERLPLENLIKSVGSAGGKITKDGIINYLRSLPRETLRQAGIEATEETISQYANTVYDILANGEKSEYNQYYVALLLDGIPADEAEEMTSIEFFLRRPGEAAAGGAVSGFVFGGVGNVGSAANYAMQRMLGNAPALTTTE